MIFHEIYGRYYQTVSKILEEAVKETLTEQRLLQIVQENAFSESNTVIPQALENGTWQLLTEDYKTPLHHIPQMPLTLLEKRWLKTLLSDPRIRLFFPKDADLKCGLKDVEPLYPLDAIVYFDRYEDGDDYTDAGYTERFYIILQALREGRKLEIHYQKKENGAETVLLCKPKHLEYSPKDDKFRLLVKTERTAALNLSRMVSCRLLEEITGRENVPLTLKREKLVMEVKAERRAPERAMLHFSHFQKEVFRQENGVYRLTLWYEKEDRAELLIRALSFGPLLKVVEPDSFITLIRERLEMQNRFLP